MPKEKLAAKYVGPRDASGYPTEYHNGIEMRDYTASEFDALPDEYKATMMASKLFDLRHEAPAEAEKAAKRVEKAPDPTPPLVVAGLADMPEPPAPKSEGKK